MGEISYHEAKELIEKEIAAYSSDAKGIVLPRIEFERNGKKNSINFKIDNNFDLYNLLCELAKTIGEDMKINRFMKDILNLEYPNTTIWIQRSYFGNEFHFKKDTELTSQEIDAIIKAYRICNITYKKLSPKQRLAELGVTIHEPANAFGWDYIAGYENVKQQIRDTIILPLKHPMIYEKIAQGTRKKYETIRPKAVLFEGPPGTGKTTTARIIGGEITVPMIYVPVESVMTKWYGESERNLAGIFDACRDLGDSLIFLDEIDSLAIARDKDMHEETRRVLSVLLRKIDGFEPSDRTIMIGATNRKNDLDLALLSRFDVSIHFPLPNLEERIYIFGNYAKHFDAEALTALARESEGMSGRNIKDICEYSERRWASKLISRSAIENVELPPLTEYLDSLKTRKNSGI